MSDYYRLQATIGGMSATIGERPVTLLGELDGPSGVLLIDIERPVDPTQRLQRVEDCALVTNDPAAADFDVLFTDEHIRGAIAAYFNFAGRGLLSLEDALARHNPGSNVEPDGIDEHGRKYRFAQNITNGQIAVIAMCWFAEQVQGFGRQIDALDDLDTQIISVGMAGGKRVVGYAMGGKLPIGEDGWPV